MGCGNRIGTKLSGVETLRTGFIANVSHELKTPLTVIQNYGTLLQSPDLSEEQRITYGKAIQEQTMKADIKQVMDFGNIACFFLCTKQ